MHYNKSDLPLNKEMLNFWNDNGYLIIEDFKTFQECDELIQRSKELIEEQDFNNQQSVFDTVSQSHNDDNYFLESGDKIRFFVLNFFFNLVILYLSKIFFSLNL